MVELPGLFRDVREATLTYTRLVANGALAGYRDFFPIGVFATQPEIINSRKPIHAISDLKGLRIRTNNNTQAKALARLGAVPKVLAFNETAAELSSGALDAATVPPAQLFDVGIGRLTSNHYLLGTSSAPLALLMNRKVFDRLPEPAKALILRYSGEWTAARFVAGYQVAEKTTLAEIEADHRRSVVMPSPADRATAQRAFKAIVDEWAAANPHNRALLTATEAELAEDQVGAMIANHIDRPATRRRFGAGLAAALFALLPQATAAEPVELSCPFSPRTKPTSISPASNPSSTPSMPREKV